VESYSFFLSPNIIKQIAGNRKQKNPHLWLSLFWCRAILAPQETAMARNINATEKQSTLK
jgi:hypothetical protein